MLDWTGGERLVAISRLDHSKTDFGVCGLARLPLALGLRGQSF